MLRFENVDFSYGPGRPILRGLTFDVPREATVRERESQSEGGKGEMGG